AMLGMACDVGTHQEAKPSPQTKRDEGSHEPSRQEGSHYPVAWPVDVGASLPGSISCDPVGLCVQQYINGFREEGFQIGGAKHGPWLAYDEKGTLRRVMHFEQGYAEGQYIIWDQNGTRRVEGKMHRLQEMERSVQDGEWTFWNANGSLLESVRYEDGSRGDFWTSRNTFHFKAGQQR